MNETPLVLTVQDLRLLELVLKSYSARPDQQDAVVHLYERIIAYLHR